ncbi:NPCBM/NEW2 domain-containing protein [Abditibacterium utsteinense]|uniref:NPCBM/NEW2 domain-containing protein n=1 Tax=Abditibacterium utsteinense TaxID=1960156 RepID=UPI001472C558|nr:NPCBM/NEW2 domain-containing protein [Abditibacterium utsteinense]
MLRFDLQTFVPNFGSLKTGGRAKQFSAWVGVDDEVTAKSGSVVFRVLGDGRELFRSKVLHNGDEAERVEVALVGVKSLILIAGDAGGGDRNEHANWGEAQIEFAGLAPIAVVRPTVARVRLTPPDSPLPQLNGARVFGVRTDAPLLFQIAASGQKPLRFSAKLPKDVQLDSQTGLLTGVLAQNEG